MTRRTRRELERAVEDLGDPETFTLQDYLWADLKNAHNGELSAGERRLLADPETHLARTAKRRLQDWRADQ